MTTTTVLPGTSLIVTVNVLDEDGTPRVPNELFWRLTDAHGNVINGRNEVSLTPASTVVFVLHGDDLAIGSNSTARQIIVWGTYNSTLSVDPLEILSVTDFKLHSVEGLP